MIDKQDYRKYLSVDNGKGILLSQYDVLVLEHYGIDYYSYSSLQELIYVIGEWIDNHYEDDVEELEEVLSHLMEMHYYYEVNK